jgi:mono/diheme cytochrome c family protein
MMPTKILPIGLLIVAALSPLAAWAQAAPVLKSMTADLPAGDREFPGGAAADAMNNNCLACHSAGMVLNQPDLAKAQWEAEVHKMISVYKAPITDADVASIIAYLDQTKGAK